MGGHGAVLNKRGYRQASDANWPWSSVHVRRRLCWRLGGWVGCEMSY